MLSKLAKQDVFHYTTKGNIKVKRTKVSTQFPVCMNNLLNDIDSKKGIILSSSYEYPGRYSRWDIGFVNPCAELKAKRDTFTFTALNARGRVLITAVHNQLKDLKDVHELSADAESITGKIKRSNEVFPEELRSRQSSIFSVIRAFNALFASQEDEFLGLYGAFGYDIVFQFEPLKLKHDRSEVDHDLVLYLPDRITVVDHMMSQSFELHYEFVSGAESTEGVPVQGGSFALAKNSAPVALPEPQRGHYADIVREAIEAFRVGDLFEVVPSHTLLSRTFAAPSAIFTNLKGINPSPYGFILNLGGKFLIGSSPEMYVRVEDKRVETCPISGTIKRGLDAVEDAEQVRKLLNSSKDEAELTMCTDVDRNDKSRICVPGSVKVIGRRQCEFYSHLIHTVDHVEGYLKPEFDSLDAFMTHMWAVTITGAPKKAAIKWIENHETSSREWYGGAVGYLAFNGNINTGLTLRTLKLENNGIAKIRVGATLLFDSIPEDEEEETYTKAAALLKAIEPVATKQEQGLKHTYDGGIGKSVLMVDHEDSFVHTLADYFRQSGATVVTLRSGQARERLAEPGEKFDLVVLSPGPGRPADFSLDATIGLCMDKGIPIFGVCLGLQGMVEYFGGCLGQLDYPQHGKSSTVKISSSSSLWAGLPAEFKVGRYHSLYALDLPDCFRCSAMSEDDVTMAIEHKTLSMLSVQFHPESIMSLEQGVGLRLINNVLRHLVAR